MTYGLSGDRTDLRRWVDGEFQFALLSVVGAQTFHEQRCKPGSGAAAERVKNQESLKSGALIGQLPDSVQHQVHDLLADGVVAARIVVGRVLFAGDQLLRMEQLSVRAGAHFVCKGPRNSPLTIKPPPTQFETDNRRPF